MRRAVVLSLVLFPATVLADEVYTRGGGRLTGEIVERGSDSIVVDIGGGRIGLPLSYVERIVAAPTPTALYRERAERLAPDDTAGWVALGHWAREQDLSPRAEEAFRHALSLDPGHAAAHQALGHVKLGDQWMTREESYRARGLVPYDGRWVTPEERQALLAERMAAAEQARVQAESYQRARESEARVREAEAQARIAEAAARLAEADARRAESAAVGIFHAWPVEVGFNSAVHSGFRRGCSRTRSFVARPGLGLAVPLVGRGGAFVVVNDRHNPAIRH